MALRLHRLQRIGFAATAATAAAVTATATGGRVVGQYGDGAVGGVVSLAQGGIQVQAGVAELSRGTGTQLDAADVLGRGELGSAGGAARDVDNAAGEDGQVVNLDVLPLQHHLLDAAHHALHHGRADGFAEAGVVVGHVLGQGFEVYRLVDGGIGVVAAMEGALGVDQRSGDVL